MLKIIIGTKQKCIDWVNGISNDADYTNYWQSTNITITKTLDSGEITGIEGASQSVDLFDLNMPAINEGWLLFIIDCTLNTGGSYTVNTIYFGGIVTAIPKTNLTTDNGSIISKVELQASSFSWELNRLTINMPALINQYADQIIKKIINDYTDSNIVRQGTLERPYQKVKVAKFNKQRRPWETCKEIAKLYDSWEFVVEASLNSSYAGGTYHFRQKTASYVQPTLNNSLIEQVGYNNCNISGNISSIKNVVTLPFYAECWRDTETFTQIIADNEIELNSSVVLSGTPSYSANCVIYSDNFSDGVTSTDTAENDINNPSPPVGHTESEGYIVEGDINEVIGLHFLDASGQNPDYGDIARTSNPEYILFEPVNLTSLRVKEITINTKGDCILCAYYDHTTSEIPDYDISRIIFGLELKANGNLYKMENGVSTQLTGFSYSDQTSYTIRNHCIVHETWVTSDSTDGNVYVNDITGFSVGDIVEIHVEGNNLEPIEAVVNGLNAENKKLYLTTEFVNIVENTKIRTKPKAKLQINGGDYGTVSGADWTTLAEMTNTFQQSTYTERLIGFCIAMQKSLIGTIKEFKAQQYPPVEVYANGISLTCSTDDDSAEMDIDCFLTSKNNRYSIEFPSDTKGKWASETKLEVRYKEKKQYDFELYDEDSLSDIAVKRGNPIVSGDNIATKKRKGALVADKEELNNNVLSIYDAKQLLANILTDRLKEKLQIKVNNLNSIDHGLIDTGQKINIELDDYPTTTEAEIQSLTIKLLGVDSSNEAQWTYGIEINITDKVADMINYYGKNNKQIIDDNNDTNNNTIENSSMIDTVSIYDAYFDFQDYYSYSLINDIYDDGRDLKKLVINNTDIFWTTEILYDDNPETGQDIRYLFIGE